MSYDGLILLCQTVLQGCVNILLADTDRKGCWPHYTIEGGILAVLRMYEVCM